ncbi:MAG: hydroxymethylbilane synthase [Cryomorphaceae bacterium]
MSTKIRIGSRGSDLALWQAKFFREQLELIDVASEIIIIQTKGDKIQHLSFDKIEGKGFFTKEIEDSLLRNEIDIAIHSHKDLETQNPPGLTVAGVSYREDPSELLLIRKEALDFSQVLNFKKGAVIGTSSARRKGQILSMRPDIRIEDIRGNVPTRINKLRSGKFDAILLAYAGVHRLQINTEDLHVEKLDPRFFIPAPAQGVLAFQCREEDHRTIDLVQQLHHSDVAEGVAIERGILAGFGGGCHIPIGVYAERHIGGFKVWATYGKEWERFPARVQFDALDKDSALKTFDRIKEGALPPRVFISRTLSPGNFFFRACKEVGLEVTATSLIEILPQHFEADPDHFDWVVFSSSNGVRTFFETVSKSNWTNKQFAAAGESTANALASYGIKASFVGSGSDMQRIAKELARAIGTQNALFPSSDRSIGSLAERLDPGQCTVITSYKTKPVEQKVNPHDAYVFTSPSNVESFHKAGNSIPADAHVVAIGPSTSAALHEYDIAHVTASIPSEPELFALLAKQNG